MNCLHFSCILGNLSVASQLVYDGAAYTSEPSLVTKKRKPTTTSLYLISYLVQPSSLLFSSTLSKMRLAIFEFLVILKCTAMSKCQPCSTFASFLLLADQPSVRLIGENLIKGAEDCKYLTSTQNLPEVSFDFSCPVQKFKILPNNMRLTNNRLQ